MGLARAGAGLEHGDALGRPARWGRTASCRPERGGHDVAAARGVEDRVPQAAGEEREPDVGRRRRRWRAGRRARGGARRPCPPWPSSKLGGPLLAGVRRPRVGDAGPRGVDVGVGRVAVQGQRLARASSRSVDEIGEVARSGGARGRGPGAVEGGGAAPVPTDGGRCELPAGVRRRRGEEVHPRRRACAWARAWRRSTARTTSPTTSGTVPTTWRPSARVDVDLERAARAVGDLAGPSAAIDLGLGPGLGERRARPSIAGRQQAAGQLGGAHGVGVAAGEERGEEAVADAPRRRGRRARSPARRPGASSSAAEAEAEALAEERPHRVVDGRRRGRRAAMTRLVERRQGPLGQERRRPGARGRGRLGAGELAAVEAPRAVGAEGAGLEAAAVGRLERVVVDDRRRGPASPSPVRTVASIDVEQLVDRHRRRQHLVGAGVAAGVGDDERVAGGEDGVEEELAVLGSAVVVAEVAGAQQEVVAVGGAAAGEGAVVEADEAHHPVGHRAHRDERAHGEVAGAERGPRRLAPEPVGEEVADLGQAQRLAAAGAGLVLRPRSRSRSSWARCQASAGGCRGGGRRRRRWRSVHAASGPGVGEAADGVAEAADRARRTGRRGRCRPSRRRRGGGRRRRGAGRPRDMATPRRSRCRPASQVPAVDGGEVVGRAVGGVEAPAGAGAPRSRRRCARGRRRRSRSGARTGVRAANAQHLGGGAGGRRRGRELGDGAEHRVGLAERTVGEAVGDAPGLGRRRRRTRRRRQRGELVDVGAEHDDVAGLEAWGRRRGGG